MKKQLDEKSKKTKRGDERRKQKHVGKFRIHTESLGGQKGWRQIRRNAKSK